ncbi:formate dehydrogenase (NAD+) [Phytophthora pseudosyringae]|uniref:Formate dehydrogenase (NAD+) n=1 Tax=Phytophthora pseudosyringae TaxID=221518 RepID=A0A8T1V885_9STRA|nr:formate dehydrogenase (NAD+) [Phytophthora pseudosyringae]
MELPSPHTDADQSWASACPLMSTQSKSLHLEDWHSSSLSAADSPATGGVFLPLLRAANACTGTAPVAATLASSPHPRGARPQSSSCRPPCQREKVVTAMRSRAAPPDAQWSSSPESVEPAIRLLRRSKRRATQPQDEHESDHHDDGSAQSTTEEEAAPVVKRKKKRGYRKATHTIRKEEIDHLRVELAELQTQIAELQRRAFAPNRDGQKEEDKQLYTNVLHNAVKKHQEAFVEIQSAMTGYAACNIQAGSPIQRTIILGKDELSRRETLRAMKAQKLQDARNFFERRLSHLNPLKSMSEDYRFENDEGDYWAVRFATSQFEPAKSVKQVFDLVVYYLCNIEISVSEKIGHLTVREDDDSGEDGITQNRLTSLTGKGLHMESNTVVFSDYDGATGPGDQDGYGLIVAEFVDEDDRHPYRPAERIRKDVNTVMEVRSYTRRQRPQQVGAPYVESSEQDTVVVLTRWSHSRLRHPNFPVRKDGWYELRENMDRWSQSMHETIMESLDSSTRCSPTWRI